MHMIYFYIKYRAHKKNFLLKNYIIIVFHRRIQKTHRGNSKKDPNPLLKSLAPENYFPHDSQITIMN